MPWKGSEGPSRLAWHDVRTLERHCEHHHSGQCFAAISRGNVASAGDGSGSAAGPDPTPAPPCTTSARHAVDVLEAQHPWDAADDIGLALDTELAVDVRFATISTTSSRDSKPRPSFTSTATLVATLRRTSDGGPPPRLSA